MLPLAQIIRYRVNGRALSYDRPVPQKTKFNSIWLLGIARFFICPPRPQVILSSFRLGFSFHR